MFEHVNAVLQPVPGGPFTSADDTPSCVVPRDAACTFLGNRAWKADVCCLLSCGFDNNQLSLQTVCSLTGEGTSIPVQCAVDVLADLSPMADTSKHRIHWVSSASSHEPFHRKIDFSNYRLFHANPKGEDVLVMLGCPSANALAASPVPLDMRAFVIRPSATAALSTSRSASGGPGKRSDAGTQHATARAAARDSAHRTELELVRMKFGPERAPIARSGFAAAMLNAKRVFVFGGWCPSQWDLPGAAAGGTHATAPRATSSATPGLANATTAPLDAAGVPAPSFPSGNTNGYRMLNDLCYLSWNSNAEPQLLGNRELPATKQHQHQQMLGRPRAATATGAGAAHNAAGASVHGVESLACKWVILPQNAAAPSSTSASSRSATAAATTTTNAAAASAAGAASARSTAGVRQAEVAIGETPSPRAYACMAACPTFSRGWTLLIHGGVDAAGTVLNDVHTALVSRSVPCVWNRLQIDLEPTSNSAAVSASAGAVAGGPASGRRSISRGQSASKPPPPAHAAGEGIGKPTQNPQLQLLPRAFAQAHYDDRHEIVVITGGRRQAAHAHRQLQVATEGSTSNSAVAYASGTSGGGTGARDSIGAGNDASLGHIVTAIDMRSISSSKRCKAVNMNVGLHAVMDPPSSTAASAQQQARGLQATTFAIVRPISAGHAANAATTAAAASASASSTSTAEAEALPIALLCLTSSSAAAAGSALDVRAGGRQPGAATSAAATSSGAPVTARLHRLLIGKAHVLAAHGTAGAAVRTSNDQVSSSAAGATGTATNVGGADRAAFGAFLLNASSTGGSGSGGGAVAGHGAGHRSTAKAGTSSTPAAATAIDGAAKTATATSSRARMVVLDDDDDVETDDNDGTDNAPPPPPPTSGGKRGRDAAPQPEQDVTAVQGRHTATAAAQLDKKASPAAADAAAHAKRPRTSEAAAPHAGTRTSKAAATGSSSNRANRVTIYDALPPTADTGGGVDHGNSDDDGEDDHGARGPLGVPPPPPPTLQQQQHHQNQQQQNQRSAVPVAQAAVAVSGSRGTRPASGVGGGGGGSTVVTKTTAAGSRQQPAPFQHHQQPQQQALVDSSLLTKQLLRDLQPTFASIKQLLGGLQAAVGGGGNSAGAGSGGCGSWSGADLTSRVDHVTGQIAALIATTASTAASATAARIDELRTSLNSDVSASLQPLQATMQGLPAQVSSSLYPVIHSALQPLIKQTISEALNASLLEPLNVLQSSLKAERQRADAAAAEASKSRNEMLRHVSESATANARCERYTQEAQALKHQLLNTEGELKEQRQRLSSEQVAHGNLKVAHSKLQAEHSTLPRDNDALRNQLLILDQQRRDLVSAVQHFITAPVPTTAAAAPARSGESSASASSSSSRAGIVGVAGAGSRVAHRIAGYDDEDCGADDRDTGNVELEMGGMAVASLTPGPQHLQQQQRMHHHKPTGARAAGTTITAADGDARENAGSGTDKHPHHSNHHHPINRFSYGSVAATSAGTSGSGAGGRGHGSGYTNNHRGDGQQHGNDDDGSQQHQRAYQLSQQPAGGEHVSSYG